MNQSFLLGARPTSTLALCRDRVGDPIKPFGKHQSHRTACLGVAVVCASIVLDDACLKAKAGGSRVVAVVGASQYVNVKRWTRTGSILRDAFQSASSTETLLRMRSEYVLRNPNADLSKLGSR